MKIICYRLSQEQPRIRPAPRTRDWMDATRQEYAYRCLPLVMANQHGWEILAEGTHEAIWNGGDDLDDIDVSSTGTLPACSHFGHGILTFPLPFILRTDPGVNLWVSGPINHNKDGIAPLTGLIETDWMPYTFTMNWKFTRPGQRVRFEDGEVICSFFPVPRGLTESVQPEIQSIEEDIPTKDAYLAWSQSRNQFGQQIAKNLADGRERGWQKEYFQGRTPDGSRFQEHQTKLNVKPFVEK